MKRAKYTPLPRGIFFGDMQLIFIKDLQGTARKGEIKNVPDGYARNYIIPKGFGVPVTPEALKRYQNEKNQKEQRSHRIEERNKHLLEELNKRTFTFEIRVGDKGQSYSAIHDTDIAERISEKLNIEVLKKQISLPKPLKELGEYQIEVNLGGGMVARPKIKLIKIN